MLSKFVSKNKRRKKMLTDKIDIRKRLEMDNEYSVMLSDLLNTIDNESEREKERKRDR